MKQMERLSLEQIKKWVDQGGAITEIPFSDKVFVLRMENGYTQEQMAERIGVTRKVYGKLERGDTNNPSYKIGSHIDTMLLGIIYPGTANRSELLKYTNMMLKCAQTIAVKVRGTHYA